MSITGQKRALQEEPGFGNGYGNSEKLQEDRRRPSTLLFLGLLSPRGFRAGGGGGEEDGVRPERASPSALPDLSVFGPDMATLEVRSLGPDRKWEPWEPEAYWIKAMNWGELEKATP